MRLVHLQVYSTDRTTPRGVSVWVECPDPERALRLAIEALAAEGWSLAEIDSDTETTADDYFRHCPSQAAFIRAQTAGTSWRFDEE